MCTQKVFFSPRSISLAHDMRTVPVQLLVEPHNIKLLKRRGELYVRKVTTDTTSYLPAGAACIFSIGRLVHIKAVHTCRVISAEQWWISMHFYRCVAATPQSAKVRLTLSCVFHSACRMTSTDILQEAVLSTNLTNSMMQSRIILKC